MTRNLALIGLLCVGSAGAVYTPPVEARTYVNLDVNVAPPRARNERIVVRRGYTWSPGYYRWDGRYRRHVWVGGYYLRERPGHHWVAGHWEQGMHGGWHFVQGHWS